MASRPDARCLLAACGVLIWPPSPGSDPAAGVTFAGQQWIPALAMFLALMVPHAPAGAEYGDVVLNRKAEEAGMRPVIFPHWFHRIRFQCRVCHSELGFEMRAGANEVTMDDISNGKFCGACHNGQTAWSVDNCDLCHSGIAGLPAGVRGGHETMGPGIW